MSAISLKPMKEAREEGWRDAVISDKIAKYIEPRTRKFVKPVEDGTLQVMVSPPGPNIAHLSMSHVKSLLDQDGHTVPGRLPTWDELRDARYLFLPDELTMAMILPPKDEYVNIHNTTFHLFELP